MNLRDSYQGHAEFNTDYFGEENQWKDIFNYVLGISKGQENKTPFFLLVGEEGLGKKKLFEKVCFELLSSGLLFQASEQIDMADQGKNPADYVKALQTKKQHFELSAATLSFGLPMLKFFSPLAIDFKVDFSKSPDAPKNEVIEHLKDSMLWQVFDQMSEEKLLFIHIAHFEDCFEPWFSFLNHYLRHVRNRKKKLVIVASLNRASEPSPLREASRLVSFLENLDTSGLKKKIHLKALNEASLRTLVEQKFNPNTFGDDFFHTLLTITSGRSRFVAEIIKVLNHDEAITENIKAMRWELEENWEASLAPYLPERFDEIVERIIAGEKADVKKETVFLFLSLGALIGNIFPVELVLKTMRREKEVFDTDALLDIVDAAFCEASPKVLEDLGFKGHLFENSDGSIAAYRFGNRIMHAYFLNRLFDEKKVYGNLLGDVLEQHFPAMLKSLWLLMRDLYHAGRNDPKEGYYQRMIDWDLPEVTFNLLQNELRGHIEAGDFKSRALHFEALFHLVKKRKHQWHAGTLLGLVKILEWLCDDFLDRGAYGMVLYYESYFLMMLGRMEDAQQAAETALLISREIGERRFEGLILSTIGDIYRAQGVYSEAMTQYQSALEISDETGDKQAKGVTLAKMGQTHSSKGAYEEASRFYQSALEIAHKIGDRHNEGLVLSKIGELYRMKRDYKEAMVCYTRVLEISNVMGDRQAEGITLGKIGMVHWGVGDYAEAMTCHESALIIIREIGDRKNEGMILSSIGGIHKERGDDEKARDFFRAAEKIEAELKKVT